MTIDTLRLALAEALCGDGGAPAVHPDFPEAAARTGGAPFAVLGFKNLELSALGFGDPSARRGGFAFSLGVYARSGDEAAGALANLAARAQSESVRALLSGVKLSAGDTKPDRDGLVVCEAVVSGEALVALTETGEAEVIDLNFSATLTGV